MSQSVKPVLLISLRPRFVTAFFNGTKTVEFRRTRPRVDAGDWIAVYESKGTKGIVGAFQVSSVTEATPSSIWKMFKQDGGITKKEFDEYYAGARTAYAISIKKHRKLPAPITLQMLRQRCTGFHPPQCYRYRDIDELVQFGGTVPKVVKPNSLGHLATTRA